MTQAAARADADDALTPGLPAVPANRDRGDTDDEIRGAARIVDAGGGNSNEGELLRSRGEVFLERLLVLAALATSAAVTGTNCRGAKDSIDTTANIENVTVSRKES